MPAKETKIAVLLTCFNRRETTLGALRALRDAANRAGASLKIFLVDDGSTDGTATAVREQYPDVYVITGDGSLYWNGGMRLAWQYALTSAADFIMWLNDDLALEPKAVDELLTFWRRKRDIFGEQLIVVGRTVSPTTGKTTYGGYVRCRGLSRLRFRHLYPGEDSSCVTMNGNCVLIPWSASKEVGINSSFYTHSMGDIDYGLRAVKAGYTIIEYPEPVGYQEKNEAWASRVAKLTVNNWQFVLFHPKGVPILEWLRFSRQHGGWLWPANFVLRYLRIIEW